LWISHLGPQSDNRASGRLSAPETKHIVEMIITPGEFCEYRTEGESNPHLEKRVLETEKIAIQDTVPL
jgi:hypothetical protein